MFHYGDTIFFFFSVVRFALVQIFLSSFSPVLCSKVCNQFDDSFISCDSTSLIRGGDFFGPVPIKVGMCCMMKNEEGFLEEYVAYYQLHGISHIVLIDDNSSLPYVDEIHPWLQTGFVTVVPIQVKVSTFEAQRASIMLCQQQLYDIGMEFVAVLDLDEYMHPAASGNRLIDDINHIIISNPTITNILVSRHSFSASPHIVEPIDRLVIESYFHRQKRNYKPFHQLPKRITRINGNGFSASQSSYHISCCGVHYCGRGKVKRGLSDSCDKQAIMVNSMDTDELVINHYARSVECYHRKMVSKWSFHDIYDLDMLFNRSVGTVFDGRIHDNYHCLLRQWLVNVTGKKPFIRYGDWKLKQVSHWL